MVKLYLDIDGVLLTKRNTKMADFGVEFIDFAADHYDCYWLTTHCKGNAETAIQYLSGYYSDSSIEKLRKIKATDWHTLKTEGIDFSSDFYWIDDAPFESEKEHLKRNLALERLLIADSNHEMELKRIIQQLRALSFCIL